MKVRKYMTFRVSVNASLIEGTFTDNIISMGSSYSFNQLVYIRDLGIIMLFSHHSVLCPHFSPSFKCLVINVTLYLFSQLAFLFQIILRLHSKVEKPNRDKLLMINKVDTDGIGYSSSFQKQFIQSNSFTVSNVMFT